jgi:hypothetical protein
LLAAHCLSPEVVGAAPTGIHAGRADTVIGIP